MSGKYYVVMLLHKKVVVNAKVMGFDFEEELEVIPGGYFLPVFETYEEAVEEVRETFPEIEDPSGYIMTMEQNHESYKA